MKTVIIGNGIAGITTAQELRKQDKKMEIHIISAETEYFYSRPALMYIYMGDMKLKHTQPFEKSYWKKQKFHLIYDKVMSIDSAGKSVRLRSGQSISYDKLVLATGSVGQKFGWKGQDLPGVTCFTNLQELEDIQKRTEKPISRAVVIGGGLIGIEAVEMLAHKGIPVSFVVREETFWNLALSPEEGRMVEEEIREHGIDLRMQTELREARAGADGNVASVILSDDTELPCELVVIATGVKPNIELASGTKLKVGRGFIVNRKLETNLKDIYAVGDCAELLPLKKGGRNNVEALWYTGRMQARVLARNILGASENYDRGIWYNSAKFMNIDFHTYGLVGHRLPGEEEIYFRAQTGRRSIRIVHINGKFTGINLLGIRFRHEVCDRWLREGRDIRYVLEHLEEANFDPEITEGVLREASEKLSAEFAAKGGN